MLPLNFQGPWRGRISVASRQNLGPNSVEVVPVLRFDFYRSRAIIAIHKQPSCDFPTGDVGLVRMRS